QLSSAQPGVRTFRSLSQKVRRRQEPYWCYPHPGPEAIRPSIDFGKQVIAVSAVDVLVANGSEQQSPRVLNTGQHCAPQDGSKTLGGSHLQETIGIQAFGHALESTVFVDANLLPPNKRRSLRKPTQSRLSSGRVFQQSLVFVIERF